MFLNFALYCTTETQLFAVMTNMKSAYKRSIIKNLYVKKALSCAELSNILKKSLPVSTQLLNSLADDGFVIDTGYAKSTGGRKPLMYTLNPNVIYVVSVAMDQYTTRIGIMNMHNEFVTPVEKFDLPLLNNKNALTVLVDKIEAVIKKSGVRKNKIAGIGIGMPGFVDIKRGLNHSYLPTNGKSIIDLVTSKTGIKTFIDNDSSIIALAELNFGIAKKNHNAMIINIGWGIGLGMVLNGELYRGYNGLAGEFTHIPLLPSGKLCSCGKTGCLDAESSLLFVVEKALEGLKKGQLSKLKKLPANNLEAAYAQILKAAKEGDQFAIGLLTDIGFKLGMGIAMLIHLFNPEDIILSGKGSAAGKILVTPIQQAVNEYCIPSLAEHASIKISTLGDDAALIGAAALVMENYENETVAAHGKLKVNQKSLKMN